MSIEEFSVQTSRNASSASMTEREERFIAPALLPVCCICELVRDETAPLHNNVHWVTQRTYRETHGVNPADIPLTHTYCPECFTKVQDTVRQYFRQIGTSPWSCWVALRKSIPLSPSCQTHPIIHRTVRVDRATKCRQRPVKAACAVAVC